MQQEKFHWAMNRREFLAGAAAASMGLASPATADAPQIAGANPFEPIALPEWVRQVTRMAFLGPGEVKQAAKDGVQVVHGNAVWPYYPLRRDGGGLRPEEDRILRNFVVDCHAAGMKLVLGLPPFPPVRLVQEYPDWRVHPDTTGSVLRLAPEENNLVTRIGCNLGPWGDYLIEVCAELVRDYHVDGFSFDGNYHSLLCYCPACQAAYRKDKGRNLPTRVHLGDLAYREYLVWRSERLEDHYRRLQQRIKSVNPDAVLMSWTVNAGRYGHFLTTPRVMSTRMNLLFDLPMQEWWLDETNFGGSIAPAFGAAYLRGITGDRPCASEAYLMSRGNPYGTDSFPAHERLVRELLAITNGGVTATSLGWPGHQESARVVFRAAAERQRWLTRTSPIHWAGLLVSEQTRQFYAYADIAERFLPHLFGTFRAASEEHLPLTLLNDWDLNPSVLDRYAVLVLANAAALSDAQVAAVRDFVRAGGGLVATGESSLYDDLGLRRQDFALADVFGVWFQGRPKAFEKHPELDANFALALGENYWKQRNGVARLSWSDHSLVRDAKLAELVPTRSVSFRGPLVRVSRPTDGAVVAEMTPEGTDSSPLPAVVCRSYGKGRVVYFAAGVEAALWSFAYPYQRRLLSRALEWAASQPAPISIQAPMCVQATYWMQSTAGKRAVVHLFNGINSTTNHGLPAMEVPLREEVVPIRDIEVRFLRDVPRTFHLEPGNVELSPRREGPATVVTIPRLDVHVMLVGEYG
jgi:hypothetical protein